MCAVISSKSTQHVQTPALSCVVCMFFINFLRNKVDNYEENKRHDCHYHSEGEGRLRHAFNLCKNKSTTEGKENICLCRQRK